MSNEFVLAADTANMQAGGTSFLEDVSNVFTKGAGAAVVSGIYGVANTAVDLSNKVFGTTVEHADTSETLHKLDQSWGDYYDNNKGVIDTAGFAATALVPGTLAIKGLKAVQAGESFGTFSKVLGYTSRKESFYLKKALSDLATEGGTVFTRINSAKVASMAWGVADNALQTAAFETAVAATMKSSPMLENEDWKHIFSDMAVTSAFGGVVGGGIGALIMNKTIKNAGKLVEAEQLKASVIGTVGRTNIPVGDKAMELINAIADLPPEALSVKIPFKEAADGVLDVTSLVDKTRKATVLRAMQQFEGKLTNIVESDFTVGRSLARALTDIAKESVESNIAPDILKQRLGDYLYNLHSVEGIGSRPLDVSGEIQYLLPTTDFTTSKAFTTIRPPAPVKAIGYRVVGDESQAKTMVLGKDAATFDEAFKAGADLVFDPTTKYMKVSPFSNVYNRVDAAELDFTPMFLNTRTKQTSFTTVPTIADVQTTAVPLTISAGGVTSGAKSYNFKVDYRTPVDSLEATARHVWGDKLNNIFGKVDTRDIALMDTLAAHPEKAGSGLVIFDAEKNTTRLFEDIAGFQTEAFKSKMKETIRLLEANPGADLRDIGYRVNATGEWVQNAIGAKLDSAAAYTMEGWKNDLSLFKERENLILRYDTKAKAAANAFPSATVAFETRIKEATRRNTDAVNTVLGEDAKLLPDLAAQIAKTADSSGTGATGLGASNADYGDPLRAAFQYVGGIANSLITKRSTAALTKLQGSAAVLLQNPKASAEVISAVTAARLSTKEWALYTDALSKERMIVDLESFLKIENGGQIKFAERIPLSEDAGNFLAAFQETHNSRIDQQTVLHAAQGISNNFKKAKLYLPPVDTQRLPSFAFVHQSDGTIFGSSEVAMITAKNADDLAAKAAAVMRDNPSLTVTFKADAEAFHKAKGTYEFGRTMNEPLIDSTLRKQGHLGDYLPNMTPEAVVNDFIQYTQRAETALVRDAISTRYAQQFAELQDLSNRYTAGQTSNLEGLSKWLKSSVQDPFGDYMKLALNISKRGEFALLHQANEFVDSLGSRAFNAIEKSMIAAKEKKITWEEANQQMEKFGLGAHFTDKEVFDIAQNAPDANLMKTAIQKGNMLIATGMLRLDWANAILNVVSTPILLGTEVQAIRNSIKNDPALFASFNSMLEQAVPGTAIKVPSTMKLLYNAVGALFSKDSDMFYKRFRDIGTVKGQAALFHEMANDISLVPKLVPSNYSKTVDKWIEKGASITGNNQAEDATRFVTSHVMYQLTQPVVAAGKMTEQEQNAFISIFTNRVQGNYISSQRPIAFQGTIGAAIGLFQTYQFNLFQQLFRHIANRDVKTVAVMGALQGTLFGLNGLPMFDAINTHIVGNASINENHSDAYSYAVQAAGKDWGDFMLYGGVSAMPLFSEQAPALWTRGDLNPRSTFILPTTWKEVPAVAGYLKVINGLTGMATQIGNGASAKDALLFGLEHNGLNRPLTGLAQVIKGSATTSKGDLISASSDWLSIATASRLIGAKPMDESIALNAMFRSKAYQALDKERADELGIVIKDKLRNNQSLSSEDLIDFQGKYAAAGGRIQGFTQAMQRWSKGANTSIVNEVMRHSQTPAGQRMITVLGGDPLVDYSNQLSDTPAP